MSFMWLLYALDIIIDKQIFTKNHLSNPNFSEPLPAYSKMNV